MKRELIRRDEFLGASLKLGAATVDLASYAATGFRMVVAGPSGCGKSNAMMLAMEQFVALGWVAVIVDTEGEAEGLYGDAVSSPEELHDLLRSRARPVIVVSASEPAEFIPYAEQVLLAADTYRKPLLLVIEETQLFWAVGRSSTRTDIGRSTALLYDIASRGRKRCLDLIASTTRPSGITGSGSNLNLFGQTQDSRAWEALRTTFRGTNLGFGDLMALSPGEFFCFGPRGLDKVRLPLAKSLSHIALKAPARKATLPGTFRQWDRAMRSIPTERLQALTPEVVSLLCVVAGVAPDQKSEGSRALSDELVAR